MENLLFFICWVSLFFMNCVCFYWIVRCFNLFTDVVEGLKNMLDILQIIADLVSTHDSNS